MIRVGLAIAAACAGACSDSATHLASNDAAADDGGIDDAPAVDDGADASDSDLAPRCDDAPDSCLRVELTARFEVSRMTEIDGFPFWRSDLLQALAVQDDGDLLVLHCLALPDAARPYDPDEARLARLDPAGGLAGDPLAFPDVPPFRAEDVRGDLVNAGDGSLLALWRVPLWSTDGPDGVWRGHRTFVTRVRGTTLEPARIFHETGPDEDDVWFLDATSVLIDGRPLVVSAGPGGILVSPLDEPGNVTTIPTARAPRNEIRAAVLAEIGTALAWSEGTAPAGAGVAGMAAVLDADGHVRGPVELFPPQDDLYADLHLAVDDDTVFVARYERDASDVRVSRIRIAHLDGELRRIEPDRWLDGWGGLSPGGMALVSWAGGAWVVFRTLDARFGSNPLLFVQPLAETPCGYSVDEPVAAFAPHHLERRGLLAAAATDALWVVASYVEDSASAELLRVTSCE